MYLTNYADFAIVKISYIRDNLQNKGPETLFCIYICHNEPFSLMIHNLPVMFGILFKTSAEKSGYTGHIFDKTIKTVVLQNFSLFYREF